MRLHEAWAPLAVTEDKVFVYGPRVGRLYLLSAAQAADARLLRVLGLSRRARHAVLGDPALRVAASLGDVRDAPPTRAAARLAPAYRFVHRSRSWLPFRATALALRRLALVRAGTDSNVRDPRELARSVYTVEQGARLSDCYPRALITAYLAVVAGMRCSVTLGMLAPTRKMHAWCVIDGVLPYEPQPEHYLFQPLWRMDLAS